MKSSRTTLNWDNTAIINLLYRSWLTAFLIGMWMIFQPGLHLYIQPNNIPQRRKQEAMGIPKGTEKILDEQRVSSWKEKLESSSGHLGHVASTIFKVPEFIRETNPSAYEPKFISIGPHHHFQIHESTQTVLFQKNPRQPALEVGVWGSST
ncbi:uncharacterized protein A4U43_C02F4490 [Asparagus officinalis]|uniref:Uncharacterized protein n=1 Tax=Asparagus officinalis TaxID=4686 RepID=A0A5P1FIK3_ASPOF|nr:uncharacterized protein A4U43_C02F4490 [Asparagus officinalis]